MRMTDDTKAWLLTLFAFVAGIVLAFAATAGAGAQEDWVPEMNQESYWEDRLGAETCTKYDGHTGYIPFDYGFVVVKGGQWVVVYTDVQAGTTVDGPIRPSNGREVEISWVMKCTVPAPTTTTTIPSTTTTVPETTTTAPETTTTTAPPTTTTTVTETTTTTEPPTTTTTPPPSSTTTTVPSSTTTEPPPPSTSTTLPEVFEWVGGARCDELYVDFEPPITGVEAHMHFDMPLGDQPPGFGATALFEEPGSYSAAVGSPTVFLLVPVAPEGTLVAPSSIEVVVEPCERPVETTEPPVVTTPTSPEAPQPPQAGPDEPVLPWTGPEAFVEWFMRFLPSSAIIVFMVMVLGAALVVRGHRKMTT